MAPTFENGNKITETYNTGRSGGWGATIGIPGTSYTQLGGEGQFKTEAELLAALVARGEEVGGKISEEPKNLDASGYNFGYIFGDATKEQRRKR